MSAREFNAVVWDLDGTLVDSAADIATAVNQVLADHNLSTLSTSAITKMIGNGAAKLLDRAFAEVEGLDVYQSDAAYARFLLHYANCCSEKTHPYPGMIELVKGLSARGYVQGICTNKPQAMTQQILKALEISEFFRAVVGGDSTEHRKPHPDPLNKCIDELGVLRPDTLMVGDSPADVGVARAVGIKVAVLPWGYTGVGVKALGADYIVNDATELSNLL